MDLELLKSEFDVFGYVAVEGLIPKEKAERLARRVMEIADGNAKVSGNTILNYIKPEEIDEFVPLFTNPVVHELALHALGPNYKINGDIGRLWAKPGQKAQGMHIDQPISGWFGQRNRPMDACPCMQMIWALTDFTKENGATEVIPFSHNSRRHLRWSEDYRRFVLPVEVPAGSAIMFHANIWHQRGENRTQDQHRVGISIPHVAQWLDPVSVGWSQIKGSVRERLPKEVQRLFPHTEEGSFIDLGSGSNY